MTTPIGKGVLEVGFDSKQVQDAGQRELVPSAKRVAGDIAGVFAAIKIAGFAKEGIDELKQAQQVGAQTSVVLKNLGGNAGITQNQIDDLSGAMLKQSGVDDELAQAAANTALRLGVQGDAVQRVVQDANDLSQSFGDITSDSELLAKALAKPEQAARLLKPAIGGLTDEQQAAIASFTAMGDTASAQNVILQAVEDRVKGAAAAYGETLPGSQAIAEQSLNNLKGELVSGAAPALQLTANLTTALTEEFDKLPDSAKTVVGTVALVGGAAAGLVRPVSDVLRVYDQWRHRTNELEGAVGALATVETEEAAASAAGAAASASATGATIASNVASNEAAAAALRRVVSNDALTFSDAELAIAEQAVEDAEIRRLISNDALIAADESLAVANTEATVSGVGLSAALGPVAIGVGVLAGALALSSLQTSHAEEVAANLRETMTRLAPDLQKVAAGEADASDVLTDFTANMVKADQVVGAGGIFSLDGHEDLTITDALNKAGISAAQFADIVAAGGPKLNAFLGSIKDPAVNRALGETAVQMEDQARKALDAGTALGDYTEEQKQAAIAANTSSDGLINYVQALQDARTESGTSTTSTQDHTRTLAELRTGLANATIATGDLTDAEKAEIDQADAAAKAQQDYLGFIDQLTAAMDKTYQSTLDVTRIHSTFEGSIDDLTASIKENGFTLDDNTDKGRANIDAALSAGDAVAKIIEKRFEETHSVKDATDAGIIYTQNLKDQLSQAGFTEDQVGQLIDTMNLTPEDITSTFSNNAVEQQIVVQKYIAELDKISPEKQTDIEALINQGRYEEANLALATLAQGRTVDFGVNVHGGGQIYITNTATGETFSEIDIAARNIPHRAAGGPLDPNQQFRGAERGFEVLLKDGVYQAPPVHSQVLDHASSEAFMRDLVASDQGTPRGGNVVIEGPVSFGSEGALRDLEWFALTRVTQTRLAGV